MSDVPDSSSFNLGLANIASQNYGPAAGATQAVQRAQAQNLQQQSQAQAMENKITAARMPWILSGLHVQTGEPEGQSEEGEEGDEGGQPATMHERLQKAQDRSGAADPSILNQEGIDKTFRDMYFVPQVTPYEKQQLMLAFKRDPSDKYGMGPKMVMAQRDFRVAQQTQQSQQNSRNDFDALAAVTNSPEGQAMNVLNRSHPETYDAIKRQFAKDPNEDRDEEDQARLFAAHAAGAVHQYTGREAVPDSVGTYRDKDTGIPIPGVDKVGLSSEQYLKLAHEAIAPTQMDDGYGGKVTVPAWRAAQLAGVKGINGPGDWIMVNASKNNLPGAAATLSQNSAQKKEAQKVATAALAKAQKQQAAAPAPADGTPPTAGGAGVARNAQGNIDPKLTEALQDDKYDYTPTENGKPYKPKIGNTPPPSVVEDLNNQTTARNNLAKDSNQGIGAASAALTMYKAAQDVLAKGNYDSGAWNAELAKYAKWLPAGWQNHMTGDYQEVAKYLGTAALQSGKGIFAKMTQMEAKMMTNELSPAPGMDRDALRDMIAKGAKISQYTVDSAKRVPAYLHSGKDANQFNTWNQEHFPMETETKVTPSKPNSGVTAPKYNDAQVRAYMQKYNLKDEQATRKHLGLL